MPKIFNLKKFNLKKKNKNYSKHWVFKVPNVDDFKNSTEFKTWGICSNGTSAKLFMKKVNSCDKLWFINKKKGNNRCM